MSFGEQDASNYDGVPVSLYMFTRGTQRWLYTNADQDYVYYALPNPLGLPDIQTYTAIPIFDSGITQSGDPSSDTVTVTMPWGNPLVELFIGTPPSEPVYLRLFKVQVNDSDQLAILAWIGTVTSVRRTDPGTAAVACNTLTQSFNRDGLRLGWQLSCPYALYDPQTCKVNKSLFSITEAIVGISGSQITLNGASALPDGSYRGGYLEWLVADSTFDRRAIEQHVGTGLLMLGLTDGLSIGQTVTAYRGCDRLIQTCHDVFNNVPNCGASPTMPGVSPFDGNPVF